MTLRRRRFARHRAVLGLLAALATALPAPPLAAQVRLPALGESASDEFSVSAEKRVGEQVMRDIRRDPDFADDPLLLDYLYSIWRPLVEAAVARGDIGPDVRSAFAWEAFLVRDRSVNAFALPGGYVGVHLGLIAMTVTRDELASVLAHEMSHVTQRHIARSVSAGSRAGMVGLATLILGLLAASRSGNVDLAQAAIYGGQAVAMQSQLNFSRDMEREADRNGFALLLGAGFAGAGMPRMFERLDQSNRLNDNGSFPYLRSHPLTTERIGEARLLVTSRPGDAAFTGSPLEHALMQARARVLMDPAVQSLRRQQELDATVSDPALGDAAALVALYGASVASMQLKEPERAERAVQAAFDRLGRAAARGSVDAAAQRLFAMLGAEVALARRDVARATSLVRLAAGDGSRAGMLLSAQVALAAGPQDPRLRDSLETLQTWLVEHRGDAGAWRLLARCAEAQGLPLRAVRADAEAYAAQGDLNGAIDRLRAGQEMARRGLASDFIESSVIDSRLRDLQVQRRELMAELRGQQGRQREPSGEPPN